MKCQCVVCVVPVAKCGHPEVPVNARLSLTNPDLAVGTAATYTCDEGYELFGWVAANIPEKKYSRLCHKVHRIWAQKRALTTFQMSLLFWGVTQPTLVFGYRRFGSAYRSSDGSTLGDGIYRPCPNVGSQLLTYSVKHPIFRIQAVQGS